MNYEQFLRDGKNRRLAASRKAARPKTPRPTLAEESRNRAAANRRYDLRTGGVEEWAERREALRAERAARQCARADTPWAEACRANMRLHAVPQGRSKTACENLTGKLAALEGTGATFEQVKFGRRLGAQDELNGAPKIGTGDALEAAV